MAVFVEQDRVEPEFTRLEPEARMTLLELVRDDDGFVRLPPGAMLFEEDDASEGAMYVLTGGTALATREGVEIQTLTAGDLAGATSALGDTPHLTTVTARTACTFARIDRARLDRISLAHPELSLEIMQAMAWGHMRLGALAVNDMKQRE